MFAAHALALRAAGVAGDSSAAKILADMPGVPVSGSGTVPALWSPFFENAIVRLGRLQSAAPVALYFNPLLDVAVFTLWERRQGQYHLISIRALPGEHLVEPDVAVSAAPPWTTTQERPFDALVRIAAARLDSFRRVHPMNARDAGYDEVTFAAAAAGLRAVLPRLAWQAVRRAQWAVETEPWLGPALARIEDALASSEPAALVAAAPDTDPYTAAVLAELPVDFTSQLTLDMVLEANGEERLLIGSHPEDGDIYVLVACRLDGRCLCTSAICASFPAWIAVACIVKR